MAQQSGMNFHGFNVIFLAQLQIAAIVKLFGKALKALVLNSALETSEESQLRGSKNLEYVTMGNPQPSS